jgi:hypothetical protein
MSSDAKEGEPSNFGNYSIFSPSRPALDDLSQPIFQSILDPDDPSYALPPKSHVDPRNLLRQPNHRTHNDHMDDEEMLRHWQECVEWMDKEEALMESNLGSNSNGEFLTPFDFEDNTYPSMEEALDEANSRVTTSLIPCSYETSPNSIGLSILPTFEISNPLTLSIYKNFKRVVIDAYVYHKYCRSHCVLKVGVGGEPILKVS